MIDVDGDAFRRLSGDFAGLTVTGMGFDREVLISAGIDRADAFAAVSSGDNTNIIAARVARETFGVKHVVARIYDAKRAEVYERLGIPTVATVRWTADRMMRHLIPDAQAEIWRDATSSISMIEVPLHNSWIGQGLSVLEDATGGRIAYMMRFGLGMLPTASTVLQDGDQVFMLVTDDMTERVLSIAGTTSEGGH